MGKDASSSLQVCYGAMENVIIGTPENVIHDLWSATEIMAVDSRTRAQTLLSMPDTYAFLGMQYAIGSAIKNSRSFAGALLGLLHAPHPINMETKDFVPRRLPTRNYAPVDVAQLEAMEIRAMVMPLERSSSDEVREHLLLKVCEACNRKEFSFVYHYQNDDDIRPLITDRSGFGVIPARGRAIKPARFWVYPPTNWAEHWKR